ncbi:MAG: hypothetical protein WA790_19195 [Sulfitobacter sp.]
MATETPNDSTLRALMAPVVKFLAMAIFLIGATHAPAMPVNPQRPYTATTCEAATDRLKEALAGNPLISKEEMADVLTLARDGARRLCGCDVTQEIITNFNTQNIEKSK